MLLTDQLIKPSRRVSQGGRTRAGASRSKAGQGRGGRPFPLPLLLERPNIHFVRPSAAVLMREIPIGFGGAVPSGKHLRQRQLAKQVSKCNDVLGEPRSWGTLRHAKFNSREASDRHPCDGIRSGR